MIFEISAGELSEFCFPQGSLGMMPSVERMHEGTRAHTKLQNAYKEDESIKYSREVPLEHTVEYSDLSIKVQGRADGIFFDKRNWFIHEIKSTYVSFESISAPLKKSHKAQMMIYAFIYAKEHGIEAIHGRLSYFCLIDEKIVDFDYTFDIASLETVFHQMVDEYANIVRLRVKSQKEMSSSAQGLKFPFDSFRRGQREGAAQIYSALIKNKNLFIQAPTGTGKTVMALFPAVKYLADEPARIFCLSAKNQTTSVTQNALDLMRKRGLKIKSCTITAKSKCCLMDEQNCSPEACPYSLDYYEKLHNAIGDLLKEDNYTPEIIRELAQKYTICPYELSLDLSLESNVIVCDYNYLFDPVVYLRRYFDENGSYIFLIDEAHNLIERSRDMYSAVITQESLRRAKKLFPKEHTLHRSFSRILTCLNKLLKQTEPLSPDDLKDISFAILNNNDAISRVLTQATVPSEAMLLQKELVRFITLIQYYSADSFRIYTTSKLLTLECIDASLMVEESISKSISTILYSATITPYEFYKNCIIPQTESFGYLTQYPFDPDNLLVLNDYTVDTRYANREKYYGIIAQKIEKYYSVTKGNVIVYFPSYSFLDEIAQSLTTPIVRQAQDHDAASRQEFLSSFKENGDCLAFAVMGSHFSEGIDIPHLNGIIIVGVALPQYNEARNHIQEYFEQKYQRGFEYAYVYPGINKVCQACGRLIRKESDKGFIILMDNRFLNYSSLLPSFWNIKKISDQNDLERHYRAFIDKPHQ